VYTLIKKLKLALRDGAKLILVLARYGGFKYVCCICGMRARKFLQHARRNRPNVQCPFCFAKDRHRFAWMTLLRRTDLFDGAPKRMLHVAPERFLESRFRKIPGVDYLSADLQRRAMVKMDITDIQYPADSFTAIFCSHVLEHVPDDRRAIAEFFRVLSPGGWALLYVPIIAEQTWEDPNITDPDERTRHFGQADHLRACGPDYIDRMRAVGFDAEAIYAKDILSEEEGIKMCIGGKLLIFLCRKPEAR
jgi:SAM-dependent methyltransferase